MLDGRALTRLRAVCFALFVTACAPAPDAATPRASRAAPPRPGRAAPPRATSPPPTVVAPDASPTTTSVPALAIDAATASAAADAGADADPPPAVALEIERPHLLYQRPRPKGSVHAAGEDETLARWNLGGSGDANHPANRPGFHPGARVRVDTKLLRGSLPKTAPFDRRRGKYRHVLSHTSLLARSRRNGYWPFRLCYEEGLRRDATIAGRTRLSIEIATSGAVRKVRSIDSKLGDADVVRCLADAAKKLSYPPPPRGVRVELSIELWPGDAPLPRNGPPPGATLDAVGEVDLDESYNVVATREAQLARCYARGLADDAALWGRVQLLLRLDAHGSVTSIREDESRFPDRRVTTCLRAALRDVAFPKPKGDGAQLVLGLRLGHLPDSK